MTDAGRHRSSTLRPQGLRAHLAHLLPRHAAFTVTVTAHELHNVPLVHGEFGLKWKLAGVTSHSGTRILDKVKPRKKPKSDTDNTSVSDAHDPIIPALVVSANPSPPHSPISRSISLASSLSSPVPDAFDDRPRLQYAPAKGMTPFIRLREHNVIWEQTLKFVVQMSVARDHRELGDCLAKFVVMQRVIPGDPDAPHNPRLGAVTLNLAQYVDSGVVTRRYLLRQSKTNATLKLTIHLEHTAGEAIYVAPPLPKGEILSGVAGFLESSDVYRSRPRASDLFTHSSSDSSDDPADASGSDSSISALSPSPSRSHHNSTNDHTDRQGRHARKKHRRPFEIAKLPAINDPRGTEKLIEALFNPVPVTCPNKLTPFTYLVEVDAEGDADGDGDSGSVVHEDPRWAMVAEPDDDASLYADSADEDALGSDYHSLRSHPSFHGSLRSKLSTRSLASNAKSSDDSDAAAVRLGVTEPRTWWQKALSPPVVG